MHPKCLRTEKKIAGFIIKIVSFAHGCMITFFCTFFFSNLTSQKESIDKVTTKLSWLMLVILIHNTTVVWIFSFFFFLVGSLCWRTCCGALESETVTRMRAATRKCSSPSRRQYFRLRRAGRSFTKQNKIIGDVPVQLHSYHCAKKVAIFVAHLCQTQREFIDVNKSVNYAEIGEKWRKQFGVLKVGRTCLIAGLLSPGTRRW